MKDLKDLNGKIVEFNYIEITRNLAYEAIAYFSLNPFPQITFDKSQKPFPIHSDNAEFRELTALQTKRILEIGDKVEIDKSILGYVSEITKSNFVIIRTNPLLNPSIPWYFRKLRKKQKFSLKYTYYQILAPAKEFQPEKDEDLEKKLEFPIETEGDFTYTYTPSHFTTYRPISSDA